MALRSEFERQLQRQFLVELVSMFVCYKTEDEKTYEYLVGSGPLLRAMSSGHDIVVHKRQEGYTLIRQSMKHEHIE